MPTLSQSYALDLTALSARTTVAPAARAFVKLAYVAMTWDEAYRSRRALRELSPEQLQDIGITRQQADQEARRGAWRT